MTMMEQAYAIRNPLEFAGYGQHFWGLTASDGPGWTTQRVRGIERPFFAYVARGAPYGPDDGTVAPWAVVASLPFAPEIVLPTVRYFQDVYPQVTGEYCLRCSFNLTFPHEGDAGPGWTSPYHFGINLGPVVLMCENYRSGLLWRLMRACPLRPDGAAAGGIYGWLDMTVMEDLLSQGRMNRTGPTGDYTCCLPDLLRRSRPLRLQGGRPPGGCRATHARATEVDGAMQVPTISHGHAFGCRVEEDDR